MGKISVLVEDFPGQCKSREGRPLGTICYSEIVQISDL